MPSCLSCGSEVGEYDSGYYSRSMLCIPCYTAKAAEIQMTSCVKCGMRIRKDEARQRGGGTCCNFCFSELERVERLPKCEACERRIESWQKPIKSVEGRFYHADCAQKMKDKRVMAECAYCHQPTDHFTLVDGGRVMCSRCSAKDARRQPGRTDGSIFTSGSGRPLLAAFVDRIGQMIG